MMLTKLRETLRGKNGIIRFAAMVHNLCHFSMILRGRRRNEIHTAGVFLKSTSVSICGYGNNIYIGARTRIRNCEIVVKGNGCSIYLEGDGCVLTNTRLVCEDDGSSIHIGKSTTMEGGLIASTEGCSIHIGNDCMFSEDVEIRNGDSHTIKDLDTNLRINKARSIYISDHVWLAAHVRVLKGARIAKGCIVANSSLVTSNLEVENSVYAGLPCKLLSNRKVCWERPR